MRFMVGRLAPGQCLMTAPARALRPAWMQMWCALWLAAGCLGTGTTGWGRGHAPACPVRDRDAFTFVLLGLCSLVLTHLRDYSKACLTESAGRGSG